MITRSFVLIVGVLFHLVYLRSIFDIYFKSPVVSVEQQFLPSTLAQPPADRLFLIVGDGLRADKLFENPQLAPFLHDKAQHAGRWGISHTRVPTESRPGHVALIAGLYEDVSAVTTGWTLNPVKFDSVFNQSRNTWAWGSPDILPMFREGATEKERITCSMYDPEEEDFTLASDRLDTWVFDHVDQFLQEAVTDESLSGRIKQSGNVFFLHLLGLDSAGHAHRPYSREYLNNIATVDAGIAGLYKTLEQLWTPEEVARTAFVFTADHGMSDWGSHGDGHPDNTRTPFIVWGSGIRQPVDAPPSTTSPSRALHDTLHETLGWYVEARERIDVAQADLAVLMSYLINTPFPRNNVGRLPVELLDAAPNNTALSSFQNARQIHAQYASKAQFKADQLHFSKMIHFQFSRDHARDGLEATGTQDWPQLQAISDAWIAESLAGMKYLQRYDWVFLRSVVTLGYVGWMLFALIFVLKTYVLPYTDYGREAAKEAKIEALMGPKIVHAPEPSMAAPPSPTSTSLRFPPDIAFVGIAAATVAYLLERSAPLSYYAYSIFPIFFWYRVAVDAPELISTLTKTNSSFSRASGAGIMLLGLFIIQGIVKAYADRRIISAMWPLASLTPAFYRNASSFGHVALWTALCCLMASFTSLPTVQTEDAGIVVLGGCIMFLVGLAYILMRGGSGILGAQVGLVALTTAVTREATASLRRKEGLPLGCQVIGWASLISSLLLPLLEQHLLRRQSGAAAAAATAAVPYQHRLMVLFLTFAPTFILLSVSYEGLFYLAFWSLLVTWLHLESRISESFQHRVMVDGHRGLQMSDARIALYFFFLIQAAFFGTGNIASVSSFSLDSVYRLVPIFNPFAMGSLLLFKLLVPFAVISAVLGLLNQKLRVPASAIFMTVLTFCDILTLNFFWMVRDEGSWLEIGSSISAFVIGGLLILFVISLEQVSEWMVGDVVM